MSAIQFFGGLFLGVGIGCPYMPIKLIGFSMAAIFAFRAWNNGHD